MTESWSTLTPVLDSPEFKVTVVEIDHRTPSLSYSVEEKISFTLNKDKLIELGYLSGPWINELKQAYLSGENDKIINVKMKNSSVKNLAVSELAKYLLLKRPQYKITYVTDGAAHQKNYDTLLPFIKNSSLLFAETCFTEQDRAQADETKHFTAKFIGKLATDAHVKKLMPIHFSKRYIGRTSEIYSELSSVFKGELGEL